MTQKAKGIVVKNDIGAIIQPGRIRSVSLLPNLPKKHHVMLTVFLFMVICRTLNYIMKPQDSLTVMSGSSGFGTDISKIPMFAKTHLYHLMGRQDLINPGIEAEIKLIKEKNPNIAVITEILGSEHRERLRKALYELGYKYMEHGNGQEFAGLPGNECDQTVIITRDQINKIELPKLKLPKKPHGHGGGMVYTHMPEQKCDIIGAHIALPTRKESFNEQMNLLIKTIRGRIENGIKKILLIGDFNITPEQLGNEFEELTSEMGFELLSPNKPTWDVLFGIRHLVREKCWDHIWGTGFESISKETHTWESDHKAVIAKIRPTELMA